MDGWRAIAILLVITNHAGKAFYSNGHDYFSQSPTRFGIWGVPVFFALSGILITKLFLEEFDKTGNIRLKRFYIRRAFRILPPAVLFLLTLAVCGLMFSRTELASTLLFFRNYLPDCPGLYTAHFWSLAVEEHFYLVWPGLLVLVGVRRGLPTAVAISLVLPLWMSADFHYHLFSRAFPAVVSGRRTDLNLDGLFCGCTMAFLLNRPAAREWLRRYYSAWLWIAFAGGIVFCLRYNPHFADFWIAALIPVLMVGTTLHPAWAMSRVLDLGPVKWVGRISYSLYLWQQPFLLAKWERHDFRILQMFPLNLAFVFLFAIASYYCVEKPLLRIGHRLAARFQAPAKEREAVAPLAAAVGD